MTGCCCYCLRNNNWVKELYTFCRVPLVVIHPRRNCAHDKMRIMNSNFGLQNLMEKAPPRAATLHIPPAMCDGGHNKLKNRTIQTFLCIQSPDVFNETCYFLESVQSSYKEREKKTQLAKKTSKCHHHYRVCHQIRFLKLTNYLLLILSSRRLLYYLNTLFNILLEISPLGFRITLTCQHLHLWDLLVYVHLSRYF